MIIVVVTQARYNSTRLPGKVLKEINNESLLEIHLKNAKRAKLPTNYIVATTTESESKFINEIAIQEGWNVYNGSIDNVLDRFYQAVVDLNPDIIVRITSDCPFTQGQIVDEAIEKVMNEGFDYVSTSLDYPDGVDVEAFTFNQLKSAWENAILTSDKEHVTPFIRKNCANKFEISPNQSEFAEIRLTVDEQSDFDCVETLINQLGTEKPWQTYCTYILEHPSEFQNQNIIRNEGYIKSLKNDANES